MPIEIRTLSAPGVKVMLVIVESQLAARGLVIASQTGDPFTLDYRPVAVAVPPDSPPVITVAEREGNLVAAGKPRSSDR